MTRTIPFLQEDNNLGQSSAWILTQNKKQQLQPVLHNIRAHHEVVSDTHSPAKTEFVSHCLQRRKNRIGQQMHCWISETSMQDCAHGDLLIKWDEHISIGFLLLMPKNNVLMTSKQKSIPTRCISVKIHTNLICQQCEQTGKLKHSFWQTNWISKWKITHQSQYMGAELSRRGDLYRSKRGSEKTSLRAAPRPVPDRPIQCRAWWSVLIPAAACSLPPASCSWLQKSIDCKRIVTPAPGKHELCELYLNETTDGVGQQPLRGKGETESPHKVGETLSLPLSGTRFGSDQ